MMEQSSGTEINKFVNHLGFKVDPCELNKAITKLKEGLMMEQFENVKRWYHAKEEVIEHEQGNWITFKEYEALLNAYKELKHRMEGLEK